MLKKWTYNSGVAFGGSQDEDDDDELNAEFDDTMNFYDTKTQRWFPAVVKVGLKFFKYFKLIKNKGKRRERLAIAPGAANEHAYDGKKWHTVLVRRYTGAGRPELRVEWFVVAWREENESVASN